MPSIASPTPLQTTSEAARTLKNPPHDRGHSCSAPGWTGDSTSWRSNVHAKTTSIKTRLKLNSARTHTRIYIYYVYIYMCMYVCIWPSKCFLGRSYLTLNWWLYKMLRFHLGQRVESPFSRGSLGKPTPFSCIKLNWGLVINPSILRQSNIAMEHDHLYYYIV